MFHLRTQEIFSFVQKKKGERGQLASTVRQLGDKRYITERGSQANESQEKFSFRSDRILQSSCYINHVWGALTRAHNGVLRGEARAPAPRLVCRRVRSRLLKAGPNVSMRQTESVGA